MPRVDLLPWQRERGTSRGSRGEHRGERVTNRNFVRNLAAKLLFIYISPEISSAKFLAKFRGAKLDSAISLRNHLPWADVASIKEQIKEDATSLKEQIKDLKEQIKEQIKEFKEEMIKENDDKMRDSLTRMNFATLHSRHVKEIFADPRKVHV
ncbi:hypothetical protein T492DRAFT_837528 [Pavlovales sp. CCMP2436]|nr:hypothetical protein T492DRAFT_837528 [Pavlovales sp. CCMP2436]